MNWAIHTGYCRRVLPTLGDGIAQMCCTSPPYWSVRDYGFPEQIGLEETPEEYVTELVLVFREVRRLLKDDGTLWLIVGDCYNGGGRGGNPGGDACTLEGGLENQKASMIRRNMRSAPGLKRKDLVGIPWRLAFALQADGWWLRSEIIWEKPNAVPESCVDRPTKVHETIFLLSKSERYFYDAAAVAELSVGRERKRWTQDRVKSAAMEGIPRRGPREDKPQGSFTGKMGDEAFRAERETRNARSIWRISTQKYAKGHFAAFPEEIPERCILAGCPAGGTVLDPFMGSGVTAAMALKHGRRFVGCEGNPEYVGFARERIAKHDNHLFSGAP